MPIGVDKDGVIAPLSLVVICTHLKTITQAVDEPISSNLRNAAVEKTRDFRLSVVRGSSYANVSGEI